MRGCYKSISADNFGRIDMYRVGSIIGEVTVIGRYPRYHHACTEGYVKSAWHVKCQAG